MDIRHRKLADQRSPHQSRDPSIGPLTLIPPKRIGPIEHDHFHAMLKAAFHRPLHRARKRIAANADVLQIDHQRIDAFQLRAGGNVMGVLSVIERKDRQPGLRIARIGEELSRRDVIPNAMLGGKQGHQFDARGTAQHLDRRRAMPVHPGRMGQQGNPFAAQQQKIAVLEHIDPHPHLLAAIEPRNREWRRCRPGGDSSRRSIRAGKETRQENACRLPQQ